MAYIATVEIDTPVLREALTAAPGVTIETEALHAVSEDEVRYMFWVGGGSLPAFEDGLAADPTIEAFTVISEVHDRRLYSVTLSEEGERMFTYSAMTDHGIVPLRETGDRTGFTIRARFPTKEALNAYREYCRDRGVGFELVRLYREEGSRDGDGNENGGADAARYGVTTAQREALCRALELGYFEIPRRTTLEAVADDLGVSTQAVSARLRRGQAALVRNTLADPGDT